MKTNKGLHTFGQIFSFSAAALMAGCNDGGTTQSISQADLAGPGTISLTPTPTPTPSASATTTSNDGTTAIQLNYVVHVGSTLTLSKAKILALNSEPTLSLGAVGTPSNYAQLTDTGTDYVFQSEVVGSSQFSYSITDSTGGIAISIITVNVLALDKWLGSFYGTDDAGNIFVLDSDGSLELAQSASFSGNPIGFNDLAMGADGTLYGKSYNGSAGTNAIYSVNASTGAATQVSANLDPSVSTSMAGLTILPDGRMVTAVSTSHTDGVSGPVSLEVVDANAGTSTTLVPMSAGYAMYGGDVKYLPDGYLYWTVKDSPGSLCGGNGDQDIVRVDLTSNAVTEVGCMGQSGVYGLGYVFGAIVGFSNNGNLLQIDLTDAATTLIEATGKTFAGGTSNPVLWNTSSY